MDEDERITIMWEMCKGHPIKRFDVYSGGERECRENPWKSSEAEVRKPESEPEPDYRVSLSMMWSVVLLLIIGNNYIIIALYNQFHITPHRDDYHYFFHDLYEHYYFYIFTTSGKESVDEKKENEMLN